MFGLLNAGFLLWCWRFVNKKAAAGVDRQSAAQFAQELESNVETLVESVKSGGYKAKLVLRKYIPKLNGKLRPLGIPVIAGKLLQTAVAKILETIYGQDFLPCSFGYRPETGAHEAVKALSLKLYRGRYAFVVEADISR